MKGINKVILVGTLGKDPDVRKTQAGGSMANVSIATNESWKDKDGKKQEQTEWHRVVFFGRLGEIAGEYLKKGSKVYLEGKLKTRKWQDKDKQDRYTTEIIASEMQMLDNASADSKEWTAESGKINIEAKERLLIEAPSIPGSKFDFSSNDEIPF